jgi:hypothetical protein
LLAVPENPRLPRSPLQRGNTSQAGDALDFFIHTENLQSLALGIRVVIRVVAPAKWYTELLNLGINDSVVSRLIDIAVGL